jgi:diaminohydroxyphosphoribosylaminopyrimidine deaminase/5-amino-6-(5-phosphoribosylamino)uracil reductase
VAQSADGFMAPEGGSQRWLTNGLSRIITHRWRTEEQAILIGKNTAITDNPQLTARHWKGKHPTRVLIDPDNEVPLNRNIFDEQSPTIVFNRTCEARKNNIEWKKVTFGEDAEIQMLNHLFEKEIQSVIIEGGAYTAETFLRAGVVDEIRVLTAPIFLYRGLRTPEFSALLNSEFRLGDNEIKIYRTL